MRRWSVKSDEAVDGRVCISGSTSEAWFILMSPTLLKWSATKKKSVAQAVVFILKANSRLCSLFA